MFSSSRDLELMRGIFQSLSLEGSNNRGGNPIYQMALWLRYSKKCVSVSLSPKNPFREIRRVAQYLRIRGITSRDRALAAILEYYYLQGIGNDKQRLEPEQIRRVLVQDRLLLSWFIDHFKAVNENLRQYNVSPLSRERLLKIVRE